MSINKVIKKVVEEISSICAANRFQFACNNDMIDFTIIWKHGVILPTILANNFSKYLKSFQRNRDFTEFSKNLMKWKTNKRKLLDINAVIKEAF